MRGEPLRACPLTPDWVDLLHVNLADDGLVVVNCVDSRELKAALPVFDERGFRFGYRWTLPAYENAIGVLSRSSMHARDWSRHLEFSNLDAPTQRQARATIRRPLRGLGKY